MIVNSFDDKSPSKINPKPKENRLKCDACIVTFSNIILDYVLKNYEVEQCSTFKMVTGTFPIYKINYNGKVFAFYQTFLGAPASVGILEDVTEVIDTDKFVVFGGSGCLDKNIAHGKIMIPTESYRDEGTSYHYLQDSESIEMNKKYKNLFKQVLDENGYKYEEGATWTTDGFYRETKEKLEIFKQKGAVCVEMEGASIAAVCEYKKLKYFTFYYAGDNLDAVEWEERSLGQLTSFEKKARVPYLAFELARKIELCSE